MGKERGEHIGIGVRMFRYGDKTVQSYLGAGGQFGTSSVFVEGSNNLHNGDVERHGAGRSTDGIDGAWTYITDPQGTNINLSQAYRTGRRMMSRSKR